jgi:TonB family protein
MSIALAAGSPARAMVCDFPAQVLTQAQPEIPDEIRGKVHEAQVAIRVDLDARGKLIRARIVRSSGFQALDLAALVAADKSTYTPARSHCKAVEGSFLFTVTYSSND